MKYGMRNRGFSLGCQPMKGFVRRLDDPTKKYWDILVYDRMLQEEEMTKYELDQIPFEYDKVNLDDLNEERIYEIRNYSKTTGNGSTSTPVRFSKNESEASIYFFRTIENNEVVSFDSEISKNAEVYEIKGLHDILKSRAL